MRLIDEKGRIFGKINIIDICLVLVIVLAVGGFFLKKASVSETQTVYKDITYTVKIEAIRKPTVEQFQDKLGQSLYVTKTGEYLGTVADVVCTDAEGLAIDKNGNYIKTTQPDRYDITIAIQTKGTETAKGVFTEGGKQLFIGETLNITSATAETSGEIMSITVEE